MQPLQTWVCDTCRNPVTSASDDGLVVWRDEWPANPSGYLMQVPPPTAPPPMYDFRIVHGSRARACDPGVDEGFAANMPLRRFLGPDGLTMMLSWLSAGPLKGGGGSRITQPDQFVDFVRRVQVPYYEQARSHLTDPDMQDLVGDANEYRPYMTDVLRQVADIANRTSPR